MKVYLAISAPVAGRAITTRAERIAPELAAMCLPAEAGPWRHEAWASRDGATLLLAWSNEPESPRLVPLLRTGHDRALGMPGYLCDPADGARLLAAEDPGAAADGLSGVFGVFRADQQGFAAVTTVVRVDAVFHAAAGEVVVAGNRALLVHLLARSLSADRASPPPIAYDLAGVASLVRHGFIMGDETPFEGVSALPAHSTLTVRHGRATIVRRDIPAAAAEPPRGLARWQQIRALADGLARSVTPLAQGGDRVTLSLTGGRDSRMIAAALYAAGVRFDAATNGNREHPDVVVAGLVAGKLGMPHRFTEPVRTEDQAALVVEDPLVRTQRSIRVVEGMISTHYNLTAPKPFTISPKFTGAGGEQFRGGYLASEKTITRARLHKRIKNMFLEHEAYQTEWAREKARHTLAPWAEHGERDPWDALDKLYLYHRSGRWAGASRVATSMAGTILYPLFDNRLTREVLAMCTPWRWSEEPMHRAISRLAPPLGSVPLANKRWRYQPASPPRVLGRRSWLAQAPVTAPKGSDATFNWRKSPDASLVAMLRERILDAPPSLMEVVDRAAIEGLLSRAPLERSLFVWSVYTAAVLLSGSWLSASAARPKIHVKTA